MIVRPWTDLALTVIAAVMLAAWWRSGRAWAAERRLRNRADRHFEKMIRTWVEIEARRPRR